MVDNPSQFLGILNNLADFLGDELSENRQRMYLAVLAPKLTLDEWKALALYAMGHETFHRVPLPAVFLERVRILRDAKAGQRPTLLPEPTMLAEEVKALIASIWPEAQPHEAPKDDEARKRLLRAQVRQVMANDTPQQGERTA